MNKSPIILACFLILMSRNLEAQIGGFAGVGVFGTLHEADSWNQQRILLNEMFNCDYHYFVDESLLYLSIGMGMSLFSDLIIGKGPDQEDLPVSAVLGNGFVGFGSKISVSDLEGLLVFGINTDLVVFTGDQNSPFDPLTCAYAGAGMVFSLGKTNKKADSLLTMISFRASYDFIRLYCEPDTLGIRGLFNCVIGISMFME